MIIEVNKLDRFVVYSFVFFNLFLCFLVGLNISVTPLAVKFIQFILTLYVAVRVVRVAQFELIDVLFVIVTSIIIFVAFILRGHGDPKFVFDAYSILIFFLFGKISKIDFVQTAYNILKVVFVISFLEVIFPKLYLFLFPVAEYYNMTRDWVSDQNLDMDNLSFYIGAIRPKESYFTFIDHRLGSSFLESLSLSYFLCFSFIVLITKRLDFTNRKFYFLVILLFSLLLMTDTRTSTLLFLISIIVYVFRSHSLNANFLSFSLLIIATALGVYLIIPSSDSELFYRLSLTFYQIQSNSILSILGLDDLEGEFNDSGYLYLINIYGIIPLILMFFYFGYNSLKVNEIRFRLAYVITALIFTTTLFFGGAILSAKISMLWFGFLGHIHNLNRKKCA